jgi:uncharacterized phage protein (TIGR02218 family)
MPRLISTPLKQHLNSGVTTLAIVWLLIRPDGKQIGFTTHDRDLSIDGICYEADSGFRLSATESTNGLEVDNTEISGTLVGKVLKAEELLKGLWDESRVKVGVCNYKALEQGIVWYNVGLLSKIQYQNGTFQTEIRGLTDLLRQPLGIHYSPGCRATFGDKHCGYSPKSEIITVYQALDRARFYATFKMTASQVEQGTLQWRSGKNQGMRMELLSMEEDLIELVLDMPFEIAIGDTALLMEGCDKSFETCVNRFNNAMNFRGEPHKPSQDKILIGPRD